MKVISISGVIGWDVTGQTIREALSKANGEEIEIQLSSVGGLVFDGLEIFNLIKNYPGKKTARLMGVAASMGSYIPLAADRIIAEANAVMMIHNAWGFGMGTAEDLRAEAFILEGLSSILADAYVKKTGKNMVEIKAMMDAETWLFGQEMVDMGLVDEIIGAPDKTKKDDAVKSARAELSVAKKLVSEYEGGDNIRRVAALVDSMIPRKEETIQSSGVAGTKAERPIKTKGNHMTLDELKASNPEVYQAALAVGYDNGIKAEQKRISDLNAWAGMNADVDKVVEDAKATGKSFADVQAQLSAASARGVKQLDGANPPAAGTAQTATPSGAVDAVEGMSAAEVAVLMAGNPKAGIQGMTIEQIRAYVRKES